MRAFFSEWFQQVAIKLYGIQPSSGGQKLGGDGTLAWPNLNQMLIWPWLDGRDNPLDDTSIMQKVLAEAFSGAMCHELDIWTDFCGVIP